MTPKNEGILWLLFFGACFVVFVADIKISGAAITIIMTIFFFWILLLSLKTQDAMRFVGKNIAHLEEKLQVKEDKKGTQITSYMCNVAISLDLEYLTNLMKNLGYDPKDDFDWSDFMGFGFDHIRDIDSELDFMFMNGQIYPAGGPRPIYSCIKLKEDILEKKYPNAPFMAFTSSSFIEVGFHRGGIEFFHFDKDKEDKLYRKKSMGSFPYFFFIKNLLDFHKKDLMEELSDKKKREMERNLFRNEKLNGWKFQERSELLGGYEDYYISHEDLWEDYNFENDYAHIRIHFEPNIKYS